MSEDALAEFALGRRPAMNDEARKEFRANVFQAWASKFSRCLAPGNTCEQQSIAAHSIQRSGPLSLLATAGHVYILAAQIDPDKLPQADFLLVGTRKASVFTGLCADHDNVLFSPIEKREFDPTDREQLRLHAYRAVLQETHASIESAARLQSSYLKACDLGLSDPNNPGYGAFFITSRLTAAYSTWLYKEECDRAMSGPPEVQFEHDVLCFPDTGPRIAVSALFSLDHLVFGGESARAAITVFPTNSGHTYAILSYLQEAAELIRAELTPVLASCGATQRYFFSRLILERCQNIVFAPALVGAMPPAQKSTILQFFNSTVLRNDSDFHSPLLSLFDPAE
jgi:hypothetical protein